MAALKLGTGSSTALQAWGLPGFNLYACQLHGIVKSLKPLNSEPRPSSHMRDNYMCLAGELQGLNEEVWVSCLILCLNLALCRC